MDQQAMPAAKDIDLQAEIASFLAAAETWRFENMHDHIEAMARRMGNAYGPSAIGMLRRAGCEGLSKDGVSVRRLPTNDPWALCGVIEASGVDPIGVVVAIKKPFTGRDSVELEIQMAGWNKTGIPTEGTPERKDWEKAIVDRTVAAGYHADLPPADEIGEFDSIGFYRLGGYSGGAEELAKAASSEHFYWHDQLLFARRSTKHFEEECYESMRAQVEPAGWLPVARAFEAACRAMGMVDEVRARVDEIATWSVRHYAIEPPDRALEAVGAALARMDGGFPGSEAIEVVAELEAQSSLRKLAPRVADLALLVETCIARGQTDRESAGDYNDLDIHVWVEPHEAGHLLRIDDERRLAVVIEGDIHAPQRLTLCETGDDRALRNAGEPGFLGSFGYDGDAPVVLAPPAYGTEEIRAGNRAVSAIESSAIEIRERTPQSAP